MCNITFKLSGYRINNPIWGNTGTLLTKWNSQLEAKKEGGMITVQQSYRSPSHRLANNYQLTQSINIPQDLFNNIWPTEENLED